MFNHCHIFRNFDCLIFMRNCRIFAKMMSFPRHMFQTYSNRRVQQRLCAGGERGKGEPPRSSTKPAVTCVCIDLTDNMIQVRSECVTAVGRSSTPRRSLGCGAFSGRVPHQKRSLAPLCLF